MENDKPAFELQFTNGTFKIYANGKIEWRVEMKLPIKIDHRFIYDADGKPVALIAPTDNAVAVVASIVRAVNSHAELVAALEVTKTMLADQPIGHAIVDVETMQTLDGVIADALAKAKGEQS